MRDYNFLTYKVPLCQDPILDDPGAPTHYEFTIQYPLTLRRYPPGDTVYLEDRKGYLLAEFNGPEIEFWKEVVAYLNDREATRLARLQAPVLSHILGGPRTR